VDAEPVGDAVDDKYFLLLVRRRREQVRRVFNGEALGGVGSVGEGAWIPYVVRVGGVKF
jgi:hypothetical protein